ncbi:ATP-dependent DNA helicase RecG [Paraferrimonas sp. SM1919]|uniref:ATP-dependent DNA helicase RecG n=1 Tax=Paraferrimonas sp. SM1919 TaxID=2662263 RepID=UPI0013D4005E|nr:ATP-dependent DNA helicase RecG [Paraferrimonas sp. SM1919]
MLNLEKLPITELKGVGDKLASNLTKLHIHTVQDLLFHLPLRYQDKTRICPIGQLQLGMHINIEGEILANQIVQGKRRMLTCTITDGTGSITLRFFNFTMGQKNALSAGKRLRAFGEIRRGSFGYEIIHPEYKIIDDIPPPLETKLTPIYPMTEGIRQATLTKLSDQAFKLMHSCGIQELLPANLQPNNLSLEQALTIIHHPGANEDLLALSEGQHPAQQRLVLEELIAHSLSMLALRQKTKQLNAIALNSASNLKQSFLDNLPFSPTAAQARVSQDIANDLAKPQPMMRLVQGDVGSGKTLVAALAALTAIDAGVQVALMAPTELLAEQHANNFKAWFAPLGIECAWVSGKQKGKARAEALEKIASGQAKMVIGTHAIFQDEVVFQNLALAIIDEQHRFGVHQRMALRQKGVDAETSPHQLIMTATPIPRTLAMTAYADLDTSIIDELPPGRTPITTVALPNSRRQDIINRVKQAALQDGRQAYWVCTLIEESEALECQAAEDTHQELQAALPELNIGLVHGRMKPAEKQSIMARFKQGELHLLVATTVIEVGVDVPNASLMIIENPERLGLAQLHQLRGRVGRGSVDSHCVLLYNPPLSKTAQSRLGVLRESNDGFVIAQKDLELRGPGEVLGSKQTGLADMKIADLSRDQSLIPLAQNIAGKILGHYPQNVPMLIKRWLGERNHYTQA